MSSARGKHLLTVYVRVPANIENDFNNWYNQQHIPERLAIAGFQSAARYESIKGEPKYIALYELDDAGVLESPAYKKLREKADNDEWDRRIIPKLQIDARAIYEQIFSCNEPTAEHAPFLLSVRLDIAPEVENEFNEWYNVDHLPRLSAVPGVVCARRYRRIGEGGGAQYLALYEMSHDQIMDSQAWSEAANTEWTLKMRPHLKPLVNFGKRIF